MTQLTFRERERDRERERERGREGEREKGVAYKCSSGEWPPFTRQSNSFSMVVVVAVVVVVAIAAVAVCVLTVINNYSVSYILWTFFHFCSLMSLRLLVISSVLSHLIHVIFRDTWGGKNTIIIMVCSCCLWNFVHETHSPVVVVAVVVLVVVILLLLLSPRAHLHVVGMLRFMFLT